LEEDSCAATKALVNRVDLLTAASVAYDRDRRAWMMDISVVRTQQHVVCVMRIDGAYTKDHADKADF